MTRQGPETASVETAIELLPCEFVLPGYLGRSPVLLFCTMEIPLLLIGKELDQHEDEDGFGEEVVV